MPLILFDCDSTLSAIEGVDELATLRPPEVAEEVERLTDQAMDGELPIADVFARRLDLVQPTRADCDEIGRRYIEHIEPTALAAVDSLRKAGWDLAILSGGFTQAIEPLARHLGIERIEAVDLHFAEDGSYLGFDEDFPTTRNGGKATVTEKLRNEGDGTDFVVVVGDGISDLETKGVADLFIGFGGVAAREVVEAGADYFVTTLEEAAALARSSRPGADR